MSEAGNTERPQWPQQEAIRSRLMPTSEALALVPKRSAEEAQLLPLRLEGNRLICAGYEPFQEREIARFSFSINRPVLVVSAPKADVQSGLILAYGINPLPEAADLVSSVTTPGRTAPAQRLPAQAAMEWGQSPTRTIAITSGKGGVGKSTLTANLGIAMARLGLRVGMIDCDFGLSNLHIMLGVEPKHTLSDVLSGRVAVHEALADGPFGVKLLAGGSGASEMARLDYKALKAGGAAFDQLQPYVDVLLVDTGAGIHEGVMTVLEAAEETLIVTTPDPSSVVDAYATIRLLQDRREKNQIGFVVNQAPDEASARMVAARLQSFLAIHGGSRAEYLGKVAADRSAAQAARTRVPYVLADPGSTASKDVESLARRLARVPASEAAGPEGFFRRLFGRPAA